MLLERDVGTADVSLSLSLSLSLQKISVLPTLRCVSHSILHFAGVQPDLGPAIFRRNEDCEDSFMSQLASEDTK